MLSVVTNETKKREAEEKKFSFSRNVIENDLTLFSFAVNAVEKRKIEWMALKKKIQQNVNQLSTP